MAVIKAGDRKRHGGALNKTMGIIQNKGKRQLSLAIPQIAVLLLYLDSLATRGIFSHRHQASIKRDRYEALDLLYEVPRKHRMDR